MSTQHVWLHELISHSLNSLSHTCGLLLTLACSKPYMPCTCHSIILKKRYHALLTKELGKQAPPGALQHRPAGGPGTHALPDMHTLIIQIQALSAVCH